MLWDEGEGGREERKRASPSRRKGKGIKKPRYTSFLCTKSASQTYPQTPSPLIISRTTDPTLAILLLLSSALVAAGKADHAAAVAGTWGQPLLLQEGRSILLVGDEASLAGAAGIDGNGSPRGEGEWRKDRLVEVVQRRGERKAMERRMMVNDVDVGRDRWRRREARRGGRKGLLEGRPRLGLDLGRRGGGGKRGRRWGR